ncbi:hypothetical protein FHT29_000696 [Rhizobium sp. SG741]|nr:hypothetical protein [Rhizobium sp. SG741]
MAFYSRENPPPVGEFKNLEEVPIPTTKMLAIGTVTENGTAADRDDGPRPSLTIFPVFRRFSIRRRSIRESPHDS